MKLLRPDVTSGVLDLAEAAKRAFEETGKTNGAAWLDGVLVVFATDRDARTIAAFLKGSGIATPHPAPTPEQLAALREQIAESVS